MAEKLQKMRLAGFKHLETPAPAASPKRRSEVRASARTAEGVRVGVGPHAR
jgi:hypothetical protein